jgi:hypothetical protein
MASIRTEETMRGIDFVRSIGISTLILSRKYPSYADPPRRIRPSVVRSPLMIRLN